MKNKLLSAFGGLAMLASTVLGDSAVTNAPVFTVAPVKVSYASRDKITISATNFNNGADFHLYKSTNLVDWARVNLTYSASDSTSVVSKTYYESDSAYRKLSDYMLSTTNVSNFTKTKSNPQ